HIFHSFFHSFDAGIGVAVEVIDACEPDHGRYSREADHITLQSLPRRGSTGEGFLGRVLGRSGYLIAADARVYYNPRVAVGCMKAPRQRLTAETHWLICA